MLRVRLTRRLQSQLRACNLDPLQIAKDFADWKCGHPDDHYLFGHDCLGIGSRHLRHVHMVPLNDEQALRRWNHAWERGRGRRTSDRYLLYADGSPREGFLLIAVIDDPGAHELWSASNAARRSSLEQVAEDFCVFGIVA